MKKNILLIAAAAMLGLAGCDNGPDYGDAVFMTGTLSSPKVKLLVEGESSTALTVSSTAKADQDITITLTAAPELLEAYNKSTGYSYVVPPTDAYVIEGNKVVIEKGKSVSTGLTITANADKLQEGQSYCLPVKIESVSTGELKVLEASRTAYVMFSKVINIKAAYLARNNAFTIYGFAGDDSPVKALEQMTIEMKVMPISFPNSPRSANGISSLVGCEENFLFRFGDGAGNPCNKLSWPRPQSAPLQTLIKKTTTKLGPIKSSIPANGTTLPPSTTVSISASISTASKSSSLKPRMAARSI